LGFELVHPLFEILERVLAAVQTQELASLIFVYKFSFETDASIGHSLPSCVHNLFLISPLCLLLQIFFNSHPTVPFQDLRFLSIQLSLSYQMQCFPLGSHVVLLLLVPVWLTLAHLFDVGVVEGQLSLYSLQADVMSWFWFFDFAGLAGGLGEV
jgi:hypothetical protein